ncbi:MAG: hypothetical protein WKI04_04580 [Ferruginibacter sp.]
MHNILFRKLPLFGLMLFMSTKTTILAPPARPTLYHKSEINSCGPSTADVLADDRGKFISILPGWGSHGYKISTRNDSTQLYFNQDSIFIIAIISGKPLPPSGKRPVLMPIVPWPTGDRRFRWGRIIMLIIIK